MIRKYNREFDTTSLLDVEYWAFRNKLTLEDGGLGADKHFENIVRECWPHFEWYSWAFEQADALCNSPVSAFTAGANASKSDLLGKYAIATWTSDPVNTLVIVCSTTTTDAKQRVWGSIVRDFRTARAAGKVVGQLNESQAMIKLSSKSDEFAASDNSSICLIAAGNEFKDDSLKRLQGRKNKRVILILDELQDCSDAIISTAIWNLSANDVFEVHAAGNAAYRSDPHGRMMEPMDGWNGINRTTHRWKIKVGLKEGVAIHFDATLPDSPNMERFSKGLPQLPFLRKAEDLMAAKTHLGEHNPIYLRQFVGWWGDADSDPDFIVTDAALASHDAYDKAEWKSPPTEIAGIDPSYSNDGDRFILHHCRWGMSTQNVWTFEYHEAIHIKPTPIKGETRDHANIRECKRICEERNISARMVGMDASAGSALLSIAHQHWSSDILGVSFGGGASDLAISLFDKRIASDVYANAVSELWYVMVEFLNAGQIRGVKPDHARELLARKFELVAGGKIRIEKKADLKRRLGFSPDIADAGAVAMMTLRTRMKILAGSDSPQSKQSGHDWKALQKKRDVVSQSQLSIPKQNRPLHQQVLDDAMRDRTLQRIKAMLTPRLK